MTKLYKLVAAALVVVLASMMALPARPAAARQSGLLDSIPVTGTLADGGTFEGVLTITQFAVQEGQLVVSGVLQGTATQGDVVTEITQSFTNVVADLFDPNGGRCDILTLDLGPINLDLLGLVVDLDEVNLDIYAVPGQGNLLGNLLCAVAGLLDQGGPLSSIINLLNQINNLL